MSHRSHEKRGMVLILVLVVIATLSLAGYTFSELMLAEHEATMVHGRKVQAHVLAESGLEMARIFMAQDEQTIEDAGGHYDNAQRFRGVLVLDDESAYERGRFTLLAPLLGEDGVEGIRYGLEDESIRLNLNTLLLADEQQDDGGRTLLMALPGMTEDVADAILDWLDPDDEPREFGAEIDEYSGLDPPYAPKNGPLETVEELLLVRGVTPWLLFGADANRNGVIDAHEVDADAMIEGVDNADGSMDRGWSAYLTLYSLESNLNSEGEPRIDVNGDDLETLYNEVEAVLDGNAARYIIAYRQSGPYNGKASEAPPPGGKPDLKQPGKFPINTVLDLIGGRVQARLEGQPEPTVLESPFPDAVLAMNIYLPAMMDYLTANPAEVIPGRININQASRTVLLGIPGMTEEIVDNILAVREPDPLENQPERRHETWLLSEGIVTLEEMKAIIPFITAGGDVYRVQVVGYFEQGGPAARIEAILDTTAQPPRQLFWRDLSHLGRGYTLETLGIEYDIQ